jgi:hypothetical protein
MNELCCSSHISSNLAAEAGTMPCGMSDQLAICQVHVLFADLVTCRYQAWPSWKCMRAKQSLCSQHTDCCYDSSR